jgi:uncharacterized protein (TIGR00369 family)
MVVADVLLKSIEEMRREFQEKYGVVLALPPPSSQFVKPEYTIYDPVGLKLGGRVGFRSELTNPIGSFQGGLICGIADEFFGPLSYIAAKKPCTTVEMNCTYHRPFTAQDAYVDILAQVFEQSRQFVFMSAELRNPKGKLVAALRSHSLILGEEALSRMSTAART